MEHGGKAEKQGRGILMFPVRAPTFPVGTGRGKGRRGRFPVRRGVTNGRSGIIIGRLVTTTGRSGIFVGRKSATIGRSQTVSVRRATIIGRSGKSVVRMTVSAVKAVMSSVRPGGRARGGKGEARGAWSREHGGEEKAEKLLSSEPSGGIFFISFKP